MFNSHCGPWWARGQCSEYWEGLAWNQLTWPAPPKSHLKQRFQGHLTSKNAVKTIMRIEVLNHRNIAGLSNYRRVPTAVPKVAYVCRDHQDGNKDIESQSNIATCEVFTQNYLEVASWPMGPGEGYSAVRSPMTSLDQTMMVSPVFSQLIASPFPMRFPDFFSKEKCPISHHLRISPVSAWDSLRNTAGVAQAVWATPLALLGYAGGPRDTG